MSEGRRCPSLSKENKSTLPLPFSPILSLNGLKDLTGLYSSTESPVNLFQKHPHRHTQKSCVNNHRGIACLTKLIHTTNHHGKQNDKCHYKTVCQILYIMVFNVWNTSYKDLLGASQKCKFLGSLGGAVV